MASIYSYRFYQVHGLAPSSTDSFTVPAGYVAVVRDIDCYCSAGVSNAEIFFEGALGQTIFLATVVALTQDSPQWRGRQVMAAGEVFTINNPSSSPWDVTISGYLLSAP